MNVQNEEYFHIHKKNCYSNNWYIGNVISTSKNSYNNFYKGLLEEYICGVKPNFFEEYKLMEYFNSNEYAKLAAIPQEKSLIDWFKYRA